MNIFDFLLEKGFKETKDPFRSGARAFFRITEGLSNCESNKMSPDVSVFVYPEKTVGNQRISLCVEMELVALVGKVWFKADPYGMTAEYFIENYQRVESALAASWEVFARVMKKED